MNEVAFTFTINNTLFFTIHSPDAMQLWRHSTNSWVLQNLNSLAASSLDLTNYRIDMGDPDDTGIYRGTFDPDIVEPGLYVCQIWKDNFVGPLANQNQQIGIRFLQWSGRAVSPTPNIPITSFSTVNEGDEYFNQKMHSQAWFNLDSFDKQRSLNTATQLINKFNYLGSKTVDSQQNEWPRSGVYTKVNGIWTLIDSAIVPNDIIVAQYEIALALAGGTDIERELRGLHVTSRGFSSARTTYDPRFVPQHLLHGVPSAVAWDYLLTYLKRDTAGSVLIRRV